MDLARKSDLLAEVKGLLRQAADRERDQEREKVGEAICHNAVFEYKFLWGHNSNKDFAIKTCN